jgi:hypothetical protein
MSAPQQLVTSPIKTEPAQKAVKAKPIVPKLNLNTEI